MKRINPYLPQYQVDQLQKIRKKTRRSLSALIQEAIDDLLKKLNK